MLTKHEHLRRRSLRPRPKELCSSYASAKRCAQGELCPLFDKGEHPRKKREARSLQTEEPPDAPEPDEPEQEDEEGDEQDDQENDEDQEDDEIADSMQSWIQRTTAWKLSTPMRCTREEVEAEVKVKALETREVEEVESLPVEEELQDDHHRSQRVQRNRLDLVVQALECSELSPHPFHLLDPNNPPHPRSNLGRDVIRASNRLKKEYIGKRKTNIGYSR
eukprot:160813-Amphidinium_carterae.1